MVDKNGVEIKTGDIVEITGAYFKNDNGLYFVESSPGDPSWSGSDYSLKKVSRAGKISKAKHSICFWPIKIFLSDRIKVAQGHQWNKEYAQIEVQGQLKDMREIAAHFQTMADNMTKHIRRTIYDWGENSTDVQKQKAIQAHYEAVAEAVMELP